LFETFVAVEAVAAGIDEAADPSQIALLELFDLAPHPRDTADDLVAGHDGVDCVPPLVAGEMHVRVADPAIENLDLHVLRPRLPALEAERQPGYRRPWPRIRRS
jgi:hypothetical protein